MAVSPTQLTTTVQQAREKALARVDADTDHSDHLFGDCARNAVTLLRLLADALSDTDNTPVVRAGGITSPSEPSPTTLTDARQTGTLHYWVEVTLPDTQTTLDAADTATTAGATRYICDICSESDATWGEPLVTETYPTDYLPLGDTYTVADLDRGQCPHDDLILQNAVQATRDAELDARDKTESDAYVLHGHCHDLGEALLRRLAPAWLDDDPLFDQGYVDCHLMVGGLDPDGDRFDQSQPLSRADVEPHDHVWVEAARMTEDGEQRYICDVYARTEWREGQPRVLTSLPDEYVRTIDGRVPLAELDSPYGWVRYRR